MNETERRIIMIDAAMVEGANLHPPLKRNDCERIIRAAFAALEPPPILCALCGGEHDQDLGTDICSQSEAKAEWREL